MTDKTMSRAEYAAYRKCSPVTISRYFRAMKLDASVLTSDNRVNVQKADEMLRRNIDPVQRQNSMARFKRKAEKTSERAGIAQGLSLSDAQALLAQYKAAVKKLEYEERTGKLVLAADVRQAAFDVARRVRDALLNIPDRLAAILAAEPDEIKVRELLAKEIREALTELAGVD